MDDKINGPLYCAALETWKDTREKIEEMHDAMERMSEYLPHLAKLDDIARSSSEIKSSNSDIKDKLVGPATAVGRIDVKVIMPIIYILCFMLGAIIAWFTGIQPWMFGVKTNSTHQVQEIKE